MRKRSTCTLLALVGAVAVTGCAARGIRPAEPAAPDRELTAGLVQREIREGTDAARVAETLGSPNIVTRDDQGRETWVYDRVSTERVETARSVGALPVTSFPLGAGGMTFIVGAKDSQKVVRTTQKTLTVVIHFDDAARVASVSLHASRF